MNEFQEAVQAAIGGRAPSRIAREAGLPPDAILRVLRGHEPLLSRARAVAEALDINFQIGPTQVKGDDQKEAPPDWASEIWEDLRAEITDLRKVMLHTGPAPMDHRAQQLEAELRQTEAERDRLRTPLSEAAIDNFEDIKAVLSRVGLSPAPWRRQVHAAGGHGANIEGEEIEGYLVFQDWWLQARGIREMSVIEVTGDSMAPTLKAGSVVLVDHQRTRRLHNHIYVVWTEDGLVVKRLMRDGDDWMMVSDNEDQETYPPVPWPEDAIVRGEVMWTGQSMRRSR